MLTPPIIFSAGNEYRDFLQLTPNDFKTSVVDLEKDVTTCPERSLTLSRVSFTNMSNRPLTVSLKTLEKRKKSPLRSRFPSLSQNTVSPMPMISEVVSFPEEPSMERQQKSPLYILHNIPFRLVLESMDGDQLQECSRSFEIPYEKGGERYNFALSTIFASNRNTSLPQIVNNS